MLRRSLPLFSTLALLASCSSSDDGGSTAPGATAAGLLAEGIAALETQTVQGVITAESKFSSALQASGDRNAPRFLLAGTRLLLLVADLGPGSELADLLTRSGVDLTGWDIFVGLQTDMLPPSTGLPDTAPHTGEFQGYFAGELADTLRGSAALLGAIEPGFSQILTIGGDQLEIDYADAKLIEAMLSGFCAKLELQNVIDLSFDIDHVEARLQSPSEPQYTIYTGSDPMAPAQGQQCSGFDGLMNETAMTAADNLFLTTPTAAAQLEAVRTDWLAATTALKAGMLAPDATESPFELIFVDAQQRALFMEGQSWLDDVIDALNGTENNVVEVATSEGILPGFVLNGNHVWNPNTYAGRSIVPDTTARPEPCDWDNTSFDHALSNPSLATMIQELSGDPLSGDDMLDAWWELVLGWDELTN